MMARVSLEPFEPRRLLAAAPLVLPDAPFLGRAGTVVVEAEHAHESIGRAGHAWADVGLGDKAGGGAVGSAVRSGPNVGAKADGSDAAVAAGAAELRIRVAFDEPGTYRIWLRGSADAGTDDSAHVGLNGVLRAPGRAVTVAPGNGYNWSNRTMANRPATLDVPTAGEHVVSVWMREDGLSLDRLVLTRDPALRPTGPGPAESGRVAPPTVTPAPAPTPALLAAASIISAPVAPTTPFDDLPWNIRRLTASGERAAFSPDGRRLAYIDHSFGDAREVDLATGVERNLTAAFPNAGFLRVQYLPDGNYLLTGPQAFVNADVSRWNDAGLWVLKADLASPPAWMGETVFEGVAVAQFSDRVAFAVTHRQHPERFPWSKFNGGKGSILYTADVRYDAGGTPYLADVAERFSTGQGIEAQDFIDEDNRVTVPRYTTAASVYAVDLYAGTWAPLRSVGGEYNEPEGVFPDRTATLVESARDKGDGRGTSQFIDVWKLDLMAASRGPARQTGDAGMSRLTRWGDFDGFKATNPVVSPDGRTIAFQTARRGAEVGTGEGIFLLSPGAAPPDATTLFVDEFDAPPDAVAPARRSAIAQAIAQAIAPSVRPGLPSYQAAESWAVVRSGAASVAGTRGVAAPSRFADGRAIAFGADADGPAVTTLERTVDARGFRNLSVRLAALQPTGGFEAADALRIDVDTGYGWVRLLTDAQAWNGVDDATADAPGVAVAGRRASTSTGFLALPASAADNPAVRVRVTMTTSAAAEAYALDRVEVAGTAIG